MMEDKQIGVPTNVAVFIDYENVYKALLEEKGFYDDGNIFFYNYKYGTKPCVGFAPISKKADLISKGIIKEADVIATYDIQKDIDDLYAKALR